MSKWIYEGSYTGLKYFEKLGISESDVVYSGGIIYLVEPLYGEEHKCYMFYTKLYPNHIFAGCEVSNSIFIYFKKEEKYDSYRDFSMYDFYQFDLFRLVTDKYEEHGIKKGAKGVLLDNYGNNVFMAEYFKDDWNHLEVHPVHKDEIEIIGTNVKVHKSGTLRFFGEWFGRPYDNYHQVTSAHHNLEEDILTIRFKGGETCIINNPRGIVSTHRVFCVEKASAITFSWYLYGSEKVDDNLRQKIYEDSSDEYHAFEILQ